MKNKILKRLICSLSVLMVCFSLFSFKSFAFKSSVSLKRDTLVNRGFKLKTVIVDAGHGGRPTGEGHFSHGASGSYSFERNVTLAIALKLQTAIEKDMTDVKAVLTRSNEDDVAWEKRADIANENKGDLFISIHCNALADRYVHEKIGTKHHKAVYKTVREEDHSGKGVLILVYGFHRTREEENAIKHNQVEEDVEADSAIDPNDPAELILINEYKRKFRQMSINFATLVNNEFTQTDGRPSEGIREQGVYVLCHSAMPSILIETGYIDNPDDEAYLNSESGQNEIVASIVRALGNYKKEVEGDAE